MQELKALKNLERLWLTETKVSGVCFKAWKDGAKLKELELRKSSFTDEGVSNLIVFSRLENLSLNDNYRVTNKALDHVRLLPRLRELALCGTQVTKDGIAAFRESRPGVDVSK